jgi:amino acid transporter
MTLIEVGGLVLIIVAGLGHGTDVVTRLPEIWPSAGDTTAWIGIAGTALTAVFAFIGLRIKARCMTIQKNVCLLNCATV